MVNAEKFWRGPRTRNRLKAWRLRTIVWKLSSVSSRHPPFITFHISRLSGYGLDMGHPFYPGPSSGIPLLSSSHLSLLLINIRAKTTQIGKSANNSIGWPWCSKFDSSRSRYTKPGSMQTALTGYQKIRA